MENERPKHRWFRFSLRTLLVAILVLSLPLSWYACRTEKSRRRREAAGPLRQAGYLMFCPPGLYDDEDRGPRTPWLVDVFGIEFFYGPNYIIAPPDSKVTTADLKRITSFPEVRCVRLDRTDVNDTGLRTLASMPNLERLHLVDTQATDAGIRHLKELGKLKELSLAGTSVTDVGLKHLEELDLRFLSVGSGVSEAALREWSKDHPNCDVYIRDDNGAYHGVD